MMVKICILSLAVPVVLRLHDRINQLKQQNLSLINEKKSFQKQVEVYTQHNLKKTVDFISENGLETINLLVEDVVFIRSADNYVEILFRESGSLRKKLIRNTLKNIEQQISSYSNFVRCHRICIINTNFIETLSRNYSNYWISVRGFDEKIPVSRQYLLKIKEIV
jgi:DNA-binding LytR/AlgR family response regulator